MGDPDRMDLIWLSATPLYTLTDVCDEYCDFIESVNGSIEKHARIVPNETNGINDELTSLGRLDCIYYYFSVFISRSAKDNHDYGLTI